MAQVSPLLWYTHCVRDGIRGKAYAVVTSSYQIRVCLSPARNHAGRAEARSHLFERFRLRPGEEVIFARLQLPEAIPLQPGEELLRECAGSRRLNRPWKWEVIVHATRQAVLGQLVWAKDVVFKMTQSRLHSSGIRR